MDCAKDWYNVSSCSLLIAYGRHKVEGLGHCIRLSPIHCYKYRQSRLEIYYLYDRAMDASTFKNMK